MFLSLIKIDVKIGKSAKPGNKFDAVIDGKNASFRAHGYSDFKYCENSCQWFSI